MNDATLMTNYVIKNKDHFAPWSPKEDNFYYTRQFWTQRLSGFEEDKRDGIALRFIIFSNQNPEGPIIGDISFTNIDKSTFQACWVSYNLDLDFTGKGLMTEALQAAINYMFEVYNLHRILAFVMPSNIKSLNLLKRLNFVIEGELKECLLINGKWEDQILLSLINKNWKQPILL
jgi:[ribosomal protein S5]-alanine N-acetyltransferase